MRSAGVLRFLSSLGSWLSVALMLVLASGCATTQPSQTHNLCEIFEQKRGWYKAAKKASNKWGIPLATNMAFVHQESRFHARAKPPRVKYLGFIPGPRRSDAYGYAQAKKDTWRWYKQSTGQLIASRKNFGDAIDFVAWYNHTSRKKNGISPTNTFGLYLAYHEGHGGFARGTWKSKPWLQAVANKVAARAAQYQAQLKGCEKRLERGWFF